MRRAPLAALLTAAAACADEALVHGLDDGQANAILVALEEGGLRASRRPGEASGSGWVVTVAPGDAARARRVLSERELPRPSPQGFGEVFGEAGMVPTPVEDHARWLHALAGELARSLESIDGVVSARVHLGLPQDDPLRPGDRPSPRAAVLVRCRPPACAALRRMEPGIRALVAGAAEGLSADAVSVLVAEAAPVPLPAPAPAPSQRWRPLFAALLAVAAAILAAVGLRPRLDRLRVAALRLVRRPAP